jgi:NDP-sugar pyrophosphorylase family protein
MTGHTALLMAGGQGTRMLSSGVSVPKPLVPILGVPLIERNLHQLARGGCDRVYVSVAENAHRIRAFVGERLQPVGKVLGIEVEELVESSPLGNIGAARLLHGRADPLLVVYSDNLSTLPIASIMEAHAAAGAHMTLAVHAADFRMPYGEVRLDAADSGRIVGYIEKPTYRVTVCSAVSVLANAALEAIPTGAPCGLSDLANALLERALYVRAYPHEAPWVDVNDARDTAPAEAIVRQNSAELETWCCGPTEPWRLDSTADGRLCAWTPLAADATADDCGSRAVMCFDVVDVAQRKVLRVHLVRGNLPPAEAVEALVPREVAERARTALSALYASDPAHGAAALRFSGPS